MNDYLKIIHLATVTSTNDYARQLGQSGVKEITVVLADHQSEGRGRLDRSWCSPAAKGIYVSFILRPKNIEKISVLSFVLAAAVVAALRDITPVTIKWPNDLMVDDKKIGGLLVEAESSSTNFEFIIAGLGLNINGNSDELPPEATSLYLKTKKEYNLGDIFNIIVTEFIARYRLFNSDNLKVILEEIKTNTRTLKKPVKILIKDNWIEGFAFDLADDGALIVQDKNGDLRKIRSSEIIHLR